MWKWKWERLEWAGYVGHTQGPALQDKPIKVLMLNPIKRSQVLSKGFALAYILETAEIQLISTPHHLSVFLNGRPHRVGSIGLR